MVDSPKRLNMRYIYMKEFPYTTLGCGQKELAKKMDMTQPGVAYAVMRGEAISKSNHLELKNMS